MSEYSASTLERLASELEADDKALLDAPFTVSEGRQYGKSYWLVLDGNGMWHADLGEDEAGAKATAHLRNSAPEVAAALRAAAAKVERLRADNTTLALAVRGSGTKAERDGNAQLADALAAAAIFRNDSERLRTRLAALEALVNKALVLVHIVGANGGMTGEHHAIEATIRAAAKEQSK